MSRVVVLDDNLLLTTQVEGALRKAGREFVTFAPTPGGARQAAQEDPTAVLVSINSARPDIAAVVAALRAGTEARIIGYCGHLETGRIQEARAAGVDRVVANSAVMADPAAILGGPDRMSSIEPE